MFDRRRGTKHAPQALAFFIEQDRPPRVVVANLDSAPSVFFHTNLLVGQSFAKHTYAVNSPSGSKSWPMPIASFRSGAEFGRDRGTADMAGLAAGSTRS